MKRAARRVLTVLSAQLLVTLVLLLSASLASAHGGAAMEMECEATVQRYTVHLDLYRGAKSFCHQLPGPGQTTLVFDLVSPELRQVPVGLRLEAIDGAEPGTLRYEKPKLYPMGVASLDWQFAVPGQYVASVDFQDSRAGWVSIRFPFRVERADPNRRLKQAAVEAVPIAAPFAVVLAAGGYLIFGRRGSSA